MLLAPVMTTSMHRRVLGIDLASRCWNDNGSALLEYDAASDRFVRVVPGAIAWPGEALTAAALAGAIDRFARSEGVAAVALDGCQGWRDPATPGGAPGVGRRCEYECRTQGKTGVYPLTYPRNQRAWIEFGIDVFAALLRHEDVRLAGEPPVRPPTEGETAYLVLECFPTSTWRASRLTPLPSKQKMGRHPDLRPYVTALRDAFALPPFEASSHDDLQAVVAALVAAGAVGGPAAATARGVGSSILDGRRVEGHIWEARPKEASGARAAAVGAIRCNLRQRGRGFERDSSRPGLGRERPHG